MFLFLEISETLKAFRHQYEMILEGEKVVDMARANLAQAEQREYKIKKEIKKIAKVSTSRYSAYETEIYGFPLKREVIDHRS